MSPSSAPASVMGLDVGTTGVKCLVIDEEGRVIGQALKEYPLHRPQPGWAEQDPADWWHAVTAASREAVERAGIDGDTVQAIGLSGQMHGSVFLDSRGRVLRPAILWCDQRTEAECAEITEAVGGLDKLIQHTSNVAQTGFTAPKIRWLEKHEPEAFAKLWKVLLPKDHVRYLMTNDYYTDVSDASGTLLLDVRRRRWSDAMLEALHLKSQQLPAAVESTEITRTLAQDAAAEMGLKAGTPVVAGAGDCAAGALGTAITEPGRLSVSIGTSGVLFAFAEKPWTDPRGRLHTFCHAVPDAWHLMGVMLMAGGSLRWLRDALAHEETRLAAEKKVDPYEVICESAAAVAPGCGGLLFLPYLQGERTPHADPRARGAFVGLGLEHDRRHLFRAVLEGVAFGLRDSLEIFRSLGVKPREIRATGGGARSPLWCQILADVFGAPIELPEVDEGPAYGVALLASVAAGIHFSIEEACENAVKLTRRVEPDASHTALYDERYAAYQGLYEALRPTFHREQARGLSNSTGR